MGRQRQYNDKWESRNANTVGRLVFSESARPGLYQWISETYADGGKVKGADVMTALEELRQLKSTD